MSRRTKWALLPGLLIFTWLLMMAMGTGPLDRTVLLAIYSGDRPVLRSIAKAVTLFGEWQFLFPLTVIVGAILLFVVKVRHQALLFLSICLIGRLLVHLQKVAIGRLRPEEREQLVSVNSLSFPSGHSTNAMIVFLAFALVVVPARYRPLGIVLAVGAAIAVGISRPMLGVHWPSDVLGGWSFGAAWVLMLAEITQRWPFDQRRQDRLDEQPKR
jgi:undecaprenyl-diphosphatase